MKELVADAGPIIALGKIHQLGLLHALFDRIILTSMVLDEIEQGRDHVAHAIEAAVIQKWMCIEKSVFLEESLRLELDVGEASVISLATAKRLPLLLDERCGRKIAGEKGLKVIGTIGILLLAKKKKKLPLVKPLLAKMCECGYWLSDALVQKAIFLAKE